MTASAVVNNSYQDLKKLPQKSVTLLLLSAGGAKG